MSTTLFEVERKQRWTGSRALVPLCAETCPTCGARLHTVVTEQPALFVHGGFGATLAHIDRWCPVCRWSLPAERQERRPDRRAA